MASEDGTSRFSFGMRRSSEKALADRLTPAEMGRLGDVRRGIAIGSAVGFAGGLFLAGPASYVAVRRIMLSMGGQRAVAAKKWKAGKEGMGFAFGGAAACSVFGATAKAQSGKYLLEGLGVRRMEATPKVLLHSSGYDARRADARSEAARSDMERRQRRVEEIEAAEREARSRTGGRQSDKGNHGGWDGKSWYAEPNDDKDHLGHAGVDRAGAG